MILEGSFVLDAPQERVWSAIWDIPTLASWIPGCTRESDALYSYRRDHRSGRFAGVVQLLDAAEGASR